MNLLDTYTNGLDGFSSNEGLQTVTGYACFEALAITRPDVLNGPWETLMWVIVVVVVVVVVVVIPGCDRLCMF